MLEQQPLRGLAPEHGDEQTGWRVAAGDGFAADEATKARLADTGAGEKIHAVMAA